MKGKEGKCKGKSMSDITNREKVYGKTRNIEDLVKKKRKVTTALDTSSTTALEGTRSAIGNGNRRMGGGRVI